MTEAKETTAAPAPPTKGAAARAEKNGAGKPKRIAWRKLKLELPAEMPGAVIFDLVDVEDRSGAETNLSLIRNVLGPDQYGQVKGKIGEDGLSMAQTDDALDDLITRVLAAYGMDVGESEASPES